MTKITLIFIFIFCTLINLFAAAPPNFPVPLKWNFYANTLTYLPANENDCYDTEQEDAKRILEKVSRKFKTSKGIKADFTLIIENKTQKVKETQQGKIYLNNNKYKIETPTFERTSDGSSTWNHFKKEGEVQITEVDQDNLNEISPSQLFNLYDKNFIFTFNNEPKENPTNQYIVIDLTPNDKSASYFKVRLYIDRVGYGISRATVFEKNGTRYFYELKNMLVNQMFKDSFFTFDNVKYKGVEVIDLR